MPEGRRAIVDLVKLRDYVLNPRHPRGRNKARVFASALSLYQADAEFLRGELLRAAAFGVAIPQGSDEFGSRYSIDFLCVHNKQQATIRSAWITLHSEVSPRLITCFVL